MHDGGGPTIQTDHAHAPGRSLLKINMLTGVNERCGQQLTFAVLGSPSKSFVETFVAHLARWILNGAARVADLQLEPSQSRGSGQTEGGS